MAERKAYEKINGVDKILRWLAWSYIALLLIEGALRKWVMPGLSDILLLARDPIVLSAYAVALTHGRFPLNKYVISGLALMSVAILATLLVGHGNLLVTAFGFRANFFHIPFAFIMGTVLFRSDVVTIGRWWLWGTLLMTALIVMQFYSPQSAWINRSVGGLEGGGFSGALGRYRPPGTFSFIVGVVWFYTFSTAFLVTGLTQHKRYSKFLMALSAMAIFIAIPVSISRSLILAAGLTFAVGLFISTFQKNALMRYVRIALIACMGLLIANQFTVLDDAKEAFLDRWERSTGESKGGVQHALVSRIIDDFIGPFTQSEDIPLLGEGMGAGTQIGAKLLTGERGFDLGESEWYRLTGEGGLILGTLFIMWRVWVTVQLGKYAFITFRRGNGLGLIFLSATAYNLLVGQFGQSTINGFMVVGIGLTIASMRPRKTVTLTTNEQSSD
jgi:hypothetical protein